MSEMSQKGGGKVRKTILRDRNGLDDEELSSPNNQMRQEIDDLREELAHRNADLEIAETKFKAVSAQLEVVMSMLKAACSYGEKTE
jgi:hypothetical protein